METVAPSSSLPLQTTPSGLPALDVLLPFASQSLALLKSTASSSLRALQWLLSGITYPIVLLTPLYYVFAPVIVFIQVSLDFLVFTPYRIIAYLLDLVYPIYVLLGVACIVGILVGGCGRLLAQKLTESIYPPMERRRRLKFKNK